jgi:hypothetical protein
VALLIDGAQVPASLQCEVWDEDIGSSDDHLGNVIIPMAHISPARVDAAPNLGDEGWYELKPTGGNGDRVAGRLRLRWVVELVSDNGVAIEYVWATVKPPPATVHLRLAMGVPGEGLSVEVLRADNLPAMPGEKADPYAAVELAPGQWRGQGDRIPKSERLKTTAMSNTLAPRWTDILCFEGVGFAPSPSSVMFTVGPNEEAIQCTLGELRRAYRERVLKPSNMIWWPALGTDAAKEVRWISAASAEQELGLGLAPEHELAGATLHVTIFDRDLLSADDLVTKFAAISLASLGPGETTDLWLEASSIARPAKHAMERR